MKHPFIKFSLIVIALMITNSLTATNPGKDFLITLNGLKLTGSIKNISLLAGKPQISFENDFGDIYTIHPATIYGFTFEDEGSISMYESKNLNGEWHFLKVENKGQILTLYTSSERQLKFSKSGASPILVEEKNPQFWLQFKGEQPFKVFRFSFKSSLRKRMDNYPELEKRLGRKGFRYKNLSAIVGLYNLLHNTQ